MHLGDVSIAIASPPGRSARGIIRMSGPGSLQLIASLTSRSLSDAGASARTLTVRGVRRIDLQLWDASTLPALAISMPGPHSYTGEDSVELQLPGNPVLLERVMQHLIERAAAHGIDIRRAEPGEFTARAYFNGRLTLDEAEGVAATIAARSDAELRAAHQLLEGRLGRFAAAQMDALAEALALVEAGIDFTDEDDVVAISPADLFERLIDAREALDDQLARAVGMEQLEAVPWVVFIGPPNAGKSTLFNALLGRTRAVVSDVAGTTRDVLVEPLSLPRGSGGEAEVMLVDLAGLDDTDASQVNRSMQQAARDAMQRAELIIRCVPPDAEPPPDTTTPGPAMITVHTKCDDARHQPSHAPAHDPLRVSAHTGTGLAALRQQIARTLDDRLLSLASDVLALQPRHEQALRAARDQIDECIQLLEPIRSERTLHDPELIATLLRSALDALGEIVGEMTPDDVLGLVFGRFCIGK